MPELSAPPPRMSMPGLADWLASPQGRYITAWEQARLDEAVADIFGFNALQLGHWTCDALRASRMPLRRRVEASPDGEVCADLAALPFAGQSCDLLVLPHPLEFHADPHQLLREAERVLIAEGHLLILGFNPISLWGLNSRLRRRDRFPWNGRYLSVPRLRDWLRLLNFDVVDLQLGCYAPPARSQRWLERYRFMEQAGRRWWEFAGSVYLLHAVKRVPGIRLITPRWQSAPLGAKALRPIAHRSPLQR